MSSIWTPGGERPIPPRPSDEDEGAAPDQLSADDQARLDDLTRQLAEAPAAVVVANHAMGLFELAALHLSRQPPLLDEASLAIDAMGLLVDGLKGRLGDAEATLQEAVAHLRLAFVQIKSAPDVDRPPPSARDDQEPPQS